jgi:A/G-specific adenine glycosylase
VSEPAVPGLRAGLGAWYRTHGRHDLPWRATRDRWAVLVSEVMLAQTQVPRVVVAWQPFMDEFPDVATATAAGPGALIAAWGRLGYPRRARRLWEAAVFVDAHGWPDDYTELPGVGRYTAGALAAQADERADAIGVDVNIRRVVQRVRGAPLSDRAAEIAAVDIGGALRGRDRLLALMDLGATVCRPRDPSCGMCPLHAQCATRGELAGEQSRRQAPYRGSMRERRGGVLARLRAEPSVRARELDADALASLVADGLARVARGRVSLPRR